MENWRTDIEKSHLVSENRQYRNEQRLTMGAKWWNLQNTNRTAHYYFNIVKRAALFKFTF